jgi:hypothetical protein
MLSGNLKIFNRRLSAIEAQDEKEERGGQEEQEEGEQVEGGGGVKSVFFSLWENMSRHKWVSE